MWTATAARLLVLHAKAVTEPPPSLLLAHRAAAAEAAAAATAASAAAAAAADAHPESLHPLISPSPYGSRGMPPPASKAAKASGVGGGAFELGRSLSGSSSVDGGGGGGAPAPPPDVVPYLSRSLAEENWSDRSQAFLFTHTGDLAPPLQPPPGAAGAAGAATAAAVGSGGGGGSGWFHVLVAGLSDSAAQARRTRAGTRPPHLRPRFSSPLL